MAQDIKQNHKPTATPSSTVISAADNHFLPPLDNDNDHDGDPAELVEKYDGMGKKKGEEGHCRRYWDENNIDDLHGLYKELQDNGDNSRGNDDNNGNWDTTEEKEREDDDVDDDDIVNIPVRKCSNW